MNTPTQIRERHNPRLGIERKRFAMKLLTPRRLAVAVAATIGLCGAAGVALAAGGSARSSGPDFTYGLDNPFGDASAAVHVVRTGNGSTQVTLHIRGVDAEPGRIFGAHVHQSPCGAAGGAAGPHYAHVGATGSLEQREVWLDFAVNAAGHGHANAKRPWPLDESSPRSVIIHADPTNAQGGAGARLACIDLDGQR
jgi:Cu-Zn family superoxide dismutase